MWKHPLIANEIFFFKLNVILHPQPHHDSGGKFVEMVDLKKKKKRKGKKAMQTTYNLHWAPLHEMLKPR